ncbi:hypothetical protein D9M70_520490 [compost metagenome]
MRGCLGLDRGFSGEIGRRPGRDRRGGYGLLRANGIDSARLVLRLYLEVLLAKHAQQPEFRGQRRRVLLFGGVLRRSGGLGRRLHQRLDQGGLLRHIGQGIHRAQQFLAKARRQRQAEVRLPGLLRLRGGQRGLRRGRHGLGLGRRIEGLDHGLLPSKVSVHLHIGRASLGVLQVV